MTKEDLITRSNDPRDTEFDYFKGYCCSKGIQTKKDLQAAELSYRNGVKKGSAKAQYGLAILLSKKGEKEEAYQLFSSAFSKLLAEANHGDHISERMISCYYLFGDRGVQRDIEKAKMYLIHAAAGGDIEAQINIGQSYLKGHVFPKDLSQARHWFAEAAQLGSEEASDLLSVLEDSI